MYPTLRVGLTEDRVVSWEKKCGRGEEKEKREDKSYLVVPLIPSLRYDRFERGELLVGHGQRAKDMLFKQRRARKRKQQRRRERLAPIMTRRESRIRLTGYRRWRLLTQLVLLLLLLLQCTERRAVGSSSSSSQTVLNVFQLLHAAELVPHVEPEITEFLLFYQRAVFALSFPSGCPYALATREFGCGELRWGWDEGRL